MGDFGERIRGEMEAMLTRYGRTIATTSGGDFAEIIRRGLFMSPPPADIVDGVEGAFKRHVTGGWTEPFGSFGWWTDGFASNVERSYPFHPALIDLVEREWANRAGFQKVRSTIQIFAAAVYAWLERASAGEWAPLLIGLGDLPLSDTKVRESLLNSGVIPDQKTVTNYREIAANDVVDSDDQRGSARRIDVERADGLLAQINPRAAERAATCMYIASLAPRSQGAVGATDAELRVAAFVPDSSCDLAEIDAVISTLEAPDRGVATLDIKPGKGGQPRRLLMSTTQTLQMFFRTQRQSVVDDDIADVLRNEARAEASAGPFDRQRFVSTAGFVKAGAKGADLTNDLIAALESAAIDEPSSRLIVLDPMHFTLLNGVDSETRTAIGAALGLDPPGDVATNHGSPSPMSVVYASSCVFAVVNTYRRNHAVAAATDVVAWQRVTEISNVASDKDLLEQARAQLGDKKQALRTNLRKAFQHIVYLGEGRNAVSMRMDKDNQSTLDGTLVWKALTEADKAFDQGEFDKTALMYQLRESDFGKSIAAIRADFYRSPRLPLLYDGDTDLKKALYEGQQAGQIEIVNAAGQLTSATRPGDINVTSSGLTIERPKPAVDVDEEGDDSSSDPGDEASGGGTTAQPQPTTGGDGSPGPGDIPPKPGPIEHRVVMSLMGSAFSGSDERDAAYKLFVALANAIDGGRVSYGKFQVDFTVSPTDADILEEAGGDLGLSMSRNDV